MRKLIVLALSLASSLAFAEAPAAPPAPPPEVKKTVDAFAGVWVLEGTATGIPGMKGTLKVKETIDCKKAAGGKVVVCNGKGKAEGMGTVEDVELITYAVEEKAVHFIGTDSMGEFHDHKCAWKDDKTLVCEPLSTMGFGQAVTVDFTLNLPDAKSMNGTETSTTKDGTKIVFELKGKRK